MVPPPGQRRSPAARRSWPIPWPTRRRIPSSRPRSPGWVFHCRFVVIFCLATGSVLEAAIGKYQGKQTGENALFRGLRDELEPETRSWVTVIMDRILISYCCSSVEWIACSGSING